MTRTRTLFLSGCFLLASCVGAEAESIRLAVVPVTDGGPDIAVAVAELESALSEEATFDLLDRTRVRQILAEQELTAAGLTATPALLKVGQLLSVDSFLFVRGLPGRKPTTVHLWMVESRTGITLASLLTTMSSLERDLPATTAQLRAAAAKLRLPLGERRLVSILGFRSEEPGRSLDGLTEAVRMLVLTELAKSPGIWVLSRSNLERLRSEQELTGTELKLKASASLIDCGLKRAPGGKEYEATLSVRPLGGGKARTTVVKAATESIGALRDALVSAALRQLNSTASTAEGTEARTEAEHFAGLADLLMAHEEAEEAVRAAEAALALSPTLDNRVRTATAWQLLSSRLFRLEEAASLRAGRTVLRYEDRAAPTDSATQGAAVATPPILTSRGSSFAFGASSTPGAGTESGPVYRLSRHSFKERANREVLSSELVIRSLKAKLREVYLAEKIVAGHVTKWRAGEKVPVRPPYLLSVQGYDIRHVFLDPEEIEARGLRRELQDALSGSYRRLLDYYARRWSDPEAKARWWLLLPYLPVPAVCSDNAGEWSSVVREAATRFESPPGATDPGFPPRLLFVDTFVETVDLASSRFSGAEGRRRAQDTLTGLTERQDPILRFLGHVGKTVFSEHKDVRSAKAGLDLLFQAIPEDSRELGKRMAYGHLDSPFAFAAMEAIRTLADPGDLESYAGNILEKVLGSRCPARTAAWQDLAEALLLVLEKQGRIADAEAWIEKIKSSAAPHADDPVIADADPKSPAGKVKLLIDFIRRKQHHYSGSFLDDPNLPEAWKAYEVRLLCPAAPSAGERLAAAMVRDENLIRIYAENIRDQWLGLRVTTNPLGVWKERSLGQATVTRGVAIATGLHGDDQVTALAATGDTVYVGCKAGGIAVFGNGRPTVRTEQDGLPSNNVRALAVHGTRLLIGFGDPFSFVKDSSGGLAEYDPTSGKFRVLASSRAKEERHGLDGGRPYAVTGILSDETRKCVWIAVAGADARSGLWRWTPGSGELDQVWKSGAEVLALYWKGAKILALEKRSGLVMVEPDTLQATRLVAHSTEILAAPADLPAPKLGTRAGQDPIGPCAFLGTRLISGGRYLHLHTESDTRSAILKRLPDGRYVMPIVCLEEMGGTVVLAGTDGHAYEIRPRDRATTRYYKSQGKVFLSLEDALIDGASASGTPETGPLVRTETGLVDFLSLKPVTTADLERTKDLGLKVASVLAGESAGRAGLKWGDLILAVDGFRFWGPGEYDLVRYRYPDRATFDFVINRDGEVLKPQLTGLKPVRRAGYHYLRQRGRLLELLADQGIPVRREILAGVDLFPPRAVGSFANWVRSHPRNARNVAWLEDYLGLYVALAEQRYSDAKAPGRPSPIPFFNRLSRFYLSIARRNQDGVKAPDWKSHGESLDFYVLYYPYPKCSWPKLGELSLSDRRFQEWLPVLREASYQTRRARRTAASWYARQEGTSVDQYVNQVKAAILHKRNHGGWPYRSALLFPEEKRVAIVKALTQRLAKDDGDAPLYACALAGPMVLGNEPKTVIDLLNFIHERSPFLALAASEIACRAASKKADLLKQVTRHARESLFPRLTPSRFALLDVYLKETPELEAGRGYGRFSYDYRGEFMGYDELFLYEPHRLKQALQE